MDCNYCGGPLVESESLAELVDKDFRRARRRHFLRRLADRLKGVATQNQLLCFSEERSGRAIVGRRSLGIQTVELADITGSVGRCWDFNEVFMPVCSCRGERWRRVDKALREGKQLPPVKLYKLGGRYFVEDGNHRVSVARYRDFRAIEADVTELLLAEAASRNLSGKPGGRD